MPKTARHKKALAVLGEPRLLSMTENPLRETSDHILYTSLYLSWMARAGHSAAHNPHPWQTAGSM